MATAPPNNPNVNFPKKLVGGKEFSIEFNDTISGLPEEVSKILKQRFLGNMTMVEIAKANGYSRETARRRLKTAIKICKKSNGKFG